MPVKKKSTIANKAREYSPVIHSGVEVVPLNQVKEHPKNPNKGNVDAIAASLFRTGQYRPIIVQRSTRYILAGNHTYKGIKKLDAIARADTPFEAKPKWLQNAETRLGREVQPWAGVSVVWIDCDDATAAAIVAADNKTASLGQIDGGALAEIMKMVDDPDVGIGFSANEVERIAAQAAKAAEEVLHTSTADALLAAAKTKEDLDSIIETADELFAEGGEDMAVTSTGRIVKAKVKDEPDPILDADDKLPGVIQITDDRTFKSPTRWEIPPLVESGLCTEVPTPLRTWAGESTRDDQAGDEWWLYLFGTDSTTGMKDPSRTVLGFYVWDENFETWWDDLPSRLTKAINTGIKYAITPNFTPNGIPRTLGLYQLFRSRYIGRYMQEVGIKVIPDLQVRENDPEIEEEFLRSLPKEVPVASLQLQNVSARSLTGKTADDEETEQMMETFKRLITKLSVQELIVYGDAPAVPLIDGMGLDHLTVHYCATRRRLRDAYIKGRAAKQAELLQAAEAAEPEKPKKLKVKKS